MEQLPPLYRNDYKPRQSARTPKPPASPGKIASRTLCVLTIFVTVVFGLFLLAIGGI